MAKVSVANVAKRDQQVHPVKMDHQESPDPRAKKDKKVMLVFNHEVSLVRIRGKNKL